MDSEGLIKLTDFYLSKILDDLNNKAFTSCCIPQYLAPEVLRIQSMIKVLIFGLYIIFFYEILTGFLRYYILRSNKINMKIFENKIKYPSVNFFYLLIILLL